MRDLLGLTGLTEFSGAPPSSVLGPESEGAPTSEGWSNYQRAAQAIARQVIADPELRSRFMPCTPVGDGAACLRDTIAEFGRRAFRRPLSDRELARFDLLVADGAQITETGAPEEVAEVLLETFLSSPSFLQHAELTQNPDAEGFRLSSHELAARLSYLLWGSTPDLELDQLADSGELADQLLEQAYRMLEDPRAREQAAAVHRRYLELDRIGWHWGAHRSKDPDRYPTYGEATASAAIEETEKFFDAIVFEREGVFAELFESTLGFVNADTASIYGLDPADFGAELQPVELDAATRPGFLTRIGFLSEFSGVSYPSPLLRGQFVMRTVLGLDAGAPPSTPFMQPPDRSLFQTNRELFEVYTRPADCAGCHASYINPPGFVLEAYDAVGAWQTHDVDTGAPIDTVADVMLEPPNAVTIRDPKELMEKLARSERAMQQYAKAWVYFTSARSGNQFDECLARDLAQKIGQDGQRLLDMIASLTQSPAFRRRTRAQ